MEDLTTQMMRMNDEASLSQTDRQIREMRLSKPIQIDLESMPLSASQDEQMALTNVLDGLNSQVIRLRQQIAAIKQGSGQSNASYA